MTSQPRQSGCWVRIWSCTAIWAAVTGCFIVTVRTGAPTSPTATWRSTDCAATITAGCSTRAAAASRNPSRTPRIRPADTGTRFVTGISGSGEGRDALGLSGTAARAFASRVGAVHLGERLRPGRIRGGAVQLAAVPGELDRPGAFRMDAFELEDPARGPGRGAIRRAIPSSRSTSSTTGSSIAAFARIPTNRIRCGPKAACVCGRMPFSSAPISSGACPSMTRTRSA